MLTAAVLCSEAAVPGGAGGDLATGRCGRQYEVRVISQGRWRRPALGSVLAVRKLRYLFLTIFTPSAPPLHCTMVTLSQLPPPSVTATESLTQDENLTLIVSDMIQCLHFSPSGSITMGLNFRFQIPALLFLPGRLSKCLNI